MCCAVRTLLAWNLQYFLFVALGLFSIFSLLLLLLVLLPLSEMTIADAAVSPSSRVSHYKDSLLSTVSVAFKGIVSPSSRVSHYKDSLLSTVCGH